MDKTAPQIHTITVDETRNVAVDFGNDLDSGELLTGTPTVTGDASLTLGSKVVSTAQLTINGRTVAIGEAVQFTVSGSTVGSYTINILCGTDASQTLEGNVKIKVIN